MSLLLMINHKFKITNITNPLANANTPFPLMQLCQRAMNHIGYNGFLPS